MFSVKPFSKDNKLEKDPRYTALLVLMESSKTRVTLDRTLDALAPRLDLLSKPDRGLANAIIYGTLRWQGYLDWIIEHFSTRPLDKIRLEILYLIRIGLFQIIFMERIPVSAAVNTAVSAAKHISHPGAAGFVNALLRKASTGFHDIDLPEPEKDPENFVAVKTSMPLWCVKRWTKTYGIEKTLSLCRSMNKIPPISIRTNTLKTTRDVLMGALRPDVTEIRTTDFAEHGLSLTKPFKPIHEIESFKKGFFQVQDEAAQLVTTILAPRPGESVLDACAGLGGKTGHIAQMMENTGKLTAFDTNTAKLEILANEMNRLGITIVSAIKMDLMKIDRQLITEQFDRVIVDAPCSGMGVLRRNPDTRWKRTKKDIARLANKQQKMLVNAAELVKPGGLLLYAVCSCEKRENEDVMNFFLKTRPDFSVDTTFPCVSENLKKKAVSAPGYFKTYPELIDMDGFFAVAMKRKTDPRS